MVVGYSIFGPDNGSHFFGRSLNPAACRNCGSCLDYGYAPNKIDISTEDFDFSVTYDNRPIVSQFILDYLKRSFNNAFDAEDIFLKISDKPKYFYMAPKLPVVEFDSARRGTRFEKECQLCGGYESVVGATPAYLKVARLLDGVFYRTDLAFGSGREKFPLVIVNVDTKQQLQSQKFRGMTFREALGRAQGPTA